MVFKDSTDSPGTGLNPGAKVTAPKGRRGRLDRRVYGRGRRDMDHRPHRATRATSRHSTPSTEVTTPCSTQRSTLDERLEEVDSGTLPERQPSSPGYEIPGQLIKRRASFRANRIVKQFDDDYFDSCKFTTFNPKAKAISNLSVLFMLGRIFGPGISRGQFRQIVRKCTSCENLCFVERMHLHWCRGDVLRTMADGFDFEAMMLSEKEHAGFSQFDIYRLLAICGGCDRICMDGMVNIHDCPA